MLGLFHKEMLLVSFDRAMAITLRQERRLLGRAALRVHRPDRFDGRAQRRSVDRLRLSVDPGPDRASVRPQHAAVLALASLIGGASAFLGFWFAYQWDWPVGPTDVVLLGLLYAISWVIDKLLAGGPQISGKA